MENEDKILTSHTTEIEERVGIPAIDKAKFWITIVWGTVIFVLSVWVNGQEGGTFTGQYFDSLFWVICICFSPLLLWIYLLAKNRSLPFAGAFAKASFPVGLTYGVLFLWYVLLFIIRSLFVFA